MLCSFPCKTVRRNTTIRLNTVIVRIDKLLQLKSEPNLRAEWLVQEIGLRIQVIHLNPLFCNFARDFQADAKERSDVMF